MSTGYSFSFPLLEGGRLVPVQDNQVELYKLMYPLQTAPRHSLAVIGLIQPLGSIMPISEQQARLFFHVLTGRSALPPRAQLAEDVRRRHDEMTARYVNSRRHTIQVGGAFERTVTSNNAISVGGNTKILQSKYGLP